jgi:hypothetical protein
MHQESLAISTAKFWSGILDLCTLSRPAARTIGLANLACNMRRFVWLRTDYAAAQRKDHRPSAASICGIGGVRLIISVLQLVLYSFHLDPYIIAKNDFRNQNVCSQAYFLAA